MGAFARMPCLRSRAVVPPDAPPPPEPQFEWQLLTAAQRKRKLEALRMRDREAKRQQREAAAAADTVETQRIQQGRPDEHDDLVILDETVEVPFMIASSHRILHYRGFTACIRCGAMASTASRQAGVEKLGANCLGSSTCSTGSLTRLRRLQRGEHPRAADRWPDGGDKDTPSPPPRILVPFQLSSTTKLLVP